MSRQSTSESILFELLLQYLSHFSELEHTAPGELKILGQQVYGEFFRFLQPIEPAAFNQEVPTLVSVQLDAIKQRDTEDMYLKKLAQLYAYFRKCYHYLNNAINSSESSGFLYNLNQTLLQQHDTELYKDGDTADTMQLTAESIALGVFERMRLFCDLAAGEIYKAVPAGSFAFFSEATESLHSVDQQQFEIIAHEKIKNELEGMAKTQKRVSIYHTGSAGDESRAASPIAQIKTLARSLSLKQKWQLLSQKKKILFGAILGVEIIGVIMTAVFVPGSQVFTIPGVAVVTAKLLTAMTITALIAAQGVGGICALSSKKAIEHSPGDIGLYGHSKADSASTSGSSTTPESSV